MLVFTVTKQGQGKVTPVDEYRLTRRGGKGVVNCAVANGDQVVSSIYVEQGDEIVIATALGKCIHFEAEDVRETGRSSLGVKMIQLEKNDRCVSATRIPRKEGK